MNQLWNVCRKNNISPNQLFLLDCLRNNVQSGGIIHDSAERAACLSKGLITEDNKLTPKSSLILDEFETLLVKTKKKVATDILGEGFLEKVQEYRELFPKNRLPSGELPRQNIQELRDKFVWFFKTYPYYNWDLILDATEYYIMMKQREGWAYMRSSSNFIKKTDPRSKETTSTLADHCEFLLDTSPV